MEPHQIFLLIGSIIGPSIFIGLYFMGKRELSKFPALETVNVIFEERWASGRAIKGNYFVRAGANGALRVYVTNDELWVTTHWIQAAAVSQSGIMHRVRLDQIESTYVNPKGQIEIEYKTPGGVLVSFWLSLKNRKEFLVAVGVEKLRTTK